MAVKTTLEQLEEVQAAITKVMEAQSVGHGDTSISRALLESLTKREETLLLRYRKEAGTGGIAFNEGIPRREY